MTVQITLAPLGGYLRLRRLLCGKAAPFRRACVPDNFLRTGRKAFRPVRSKKKESAWAGKPEAFRTAGGEAALNPGCLR
jgi:hypothetical protein